MSSEVDLIFLSAVKNYRDGLKLMEEFCWSSAVRCFHVVLEHSLALGACPMSDEVMSNVADICLKTGQQLNAMLHCKLAMDCFNQAFALLGNVKVKSPSIVSELCVAYSCEHQTSLYVKDMENVMIVMHRRLGTVKDCPQTTRSRAILGQTLLDVGVFQVEDIMCSTAANTLELAETFLVALPSSKICESNAQLLTSLGYCYLILANKRAIECLAESLDIWKALNWPLHQIDAIVNTMKLYVESQLRAKCSRRDNDTCRNMLRFHRLAMKYHLGMQVAEAFTHLGMVAFHNENESVQYFERSLKLYKAEPDYPDCKMEMLKLLRYIGISSYNGRDYRKAASAYQECLDLLENWNSSGSNKLGHVADCCASLGFTYSRLRDFENMLQNYERALELQPWLTAEDLELIETNIGSLYFVKALKCKAAGDADVSNSYMEKADKAFNKALRYSWKSFPFINYGYYLLCRESYGEAANLLHQGYLNGVIDKDTVEFDHTEDPILIDDLKLELEGREDIRMPSTVLALYLKVISQANMGNIVGARHTAAQLRPEVYACKYDSYYVEGFGLDRMKALSYSLLGYAYRAVGFHAQSCEAFQSALNFLPDYDAAMVNLELEKRRLRAKAK